MPNLLVGDPAYAPTCKDPHVHEQGVPVSMAVIGSVAVCNVGYPRLPADSWTTRVSRQMCPFNPYARRSSSTRRTISLAAGQSHGEVRAQRVR
jgi:hypothetical protein